MCVAETNKTGADLQTNSSAVLYMHDKEEKIGFISCFVRIRNYNCRMNEMMMFVNAQLVITL